MPETALDGRDDGNSDDLYTKIRAIVEPIGGIELDLPARSAVRPNPFLRWQYEDDELDNS